MFLLQLPGVGGSPSSSNPNDLLQTIRNLGTPGTPTAPPTTGGPTAPPTTGGPNLLDTIRGLGVPGAGVPGGVGGQGGLVAVPPAQTSAVIGTRIQGLVTNLGLTYVEPVAAAAGPPPVAAVPGHYIQPGRAAAPAGPGGVPPAVTAIPAGGPNERYFPQMDGTLFVVGRPGANAGEIFAPTTITGTQAGGQPVFDMNRTTPLPHTMALAHLGLLRHNRAPNANGTFTQAGTTYHLQLDGSVIGLAAGANTGTLTSVAFNGAGATSTTVTTTANAAPLIHTLGLSHLGVSPNRNPDGSFSRPNDTGRFFLQADGSIFYTGRNTPQGQVAAYTLVPSAAVPAAAGPPPVAAIPAGATWTIDNTRGTQLTTTANYNRLGLYISGGNGTPASPFIHSALYATANPGQSTVPVLGGPPASAVPHNGHFTINGNTIIFNGGRINGAPQGRQRFEVPAGSPPGTQPIWVPDPTPATPISTTGGPQPVVHTGGAPHNPGFF